MREAAARALEALGEHAKEHAAAIAARLEDEVSEVRLLSVQALRAPGERRRSTQER